MELDKQEWRTLHKALDEWEKEGKLTHEQTGELRKSIQLKRNERQQIAQYFFIVAISCTILAFGALFIDEKFLEKIKNYFSLSNMFIALLCALLAGVWFWYINRIRDRHSDIAQEVYMVLGGLLTVTSVVYFCKDIGFGAKYNGFLIVCAAMLTSLSVLFRSRALWIAGVLAVMGWYGSFSAWQQNSGNLFIGMNYPMRFAVFGLVILVLSFLQKNVVRLQFAQHITYIAGMLIFFTGMWGVSIFGNYGNMAAWAQVRQVQVLAYSIVFAAFAILSFYLGLKYRNDAARDFGILFLLLNLYSRYFEYFWDAINKGIFFLVLAVSFWFVGRWIEKNKRFRKPDIKRRSLKL